MLVLPLWFDVLARLTHLLVYCDLRLSRLLILTQEDVHGLSHNMALHMGTMKAQVTTEMEKGNAEMEIELALICHVPQGRAMEFQAAH